MDKNEIIARSLAMYQVKSIEELPDMALLEIVTLAIPPDYGGVMRIYEESDDGERKALMDDIRRYLAGEVEMTYRLVNNEGVSRSENADYFGFCRRHSVWYSVTPTL